MWPKLTNIEPNIASKIKSYSDSMEASKLNAWIRVFSGAIVGSNQGLIMQSNDSDFKLFKAAGDTNPTIYGGLQSSGVLGKDWNGNAVETALGRRLRPSPIITSFSVKEGKDQISRQATLEIKAFSLEQMEMIQSYFLEPGYSLYIEWGWNTTDGVRNITTATGTDNIVKTIAKKSLNWNDLSKTRSNSNGEFDCFLGFIVGGNVSGDSENFNITVELRGAPSLPTYMQSHQGPTKLDPDGSIAETRKVENLFGPSDYEANAVGEGGVDNSKITLRRFARMFNDLPAFRQTTDVYNLKNKAKYNQFLNFDDVIKKQVQTAVSDKWFQSDTVDITAGTEKIPIAKENLFSEKRFIRMDLAVDILNQIGAIDRYQMGDKEITFKISIDNTVIGSFPCMFSTKSDKLIIADGVPDFFQYYLQIEKIKQLSGGLGGCKLEVDGKEKPPISYADQLEKFRPSEDLNKFGYKEKAHYWGYLRNLFVNFEMFKSKIEQKNKNIREILLDILNEMSSAVNSFWNFQIVEAPYVKSAAFDGIPTEYNKELEDGDIILTVIDENFIGQNPNDLPVFFRHIGSGSVFLDANIDISVPAEMTNQIVMNRLGGSSNPDESIVSTKSKSFFESKNDLFLSAVGAAQSPSSGSSEESLEDAAESAKEELESVKLITKSGTATQGSSTIDYYELDANGKEVFVGSVTYSGGGVTYYDPQSKIARQEAAQAKVNEANKKIQEAKTANLTAYLEKLTVLPNSKWANLGLSTADLNSEEELKKIDDTGELALKKWFCIYSYDDTDYFDRLKRDSFSKKGGETLSHPLPIKYNFKILGNSGIRRGDTFSILGIPTKYKDKGIFQVTQIEHSLEGNQWFTNITGDYRQIQ